MGNLCPWCVKKESSSSLSNGYLTENSDVLSSQSPHNFDARTPLLGNSYNHHGNTSITHVYGDSSSLSTTVTSQPSGRLTTSSRGSSNETAQRKMTMIVDDLVPKLLDVCGNSSTGHAPSTGSNNQFRQTVQQSLASSRLPVLPDVGLLNLPSLLADRPISSDTCYHVARTAEELSRLFVDEIKITHRGNIVAIFE